MAIAAIAPRSSVAVIRLPDSLHEGPCVIPARLTGPGCLCFVICSLRVWRMNMARRNRSNSRNRRRAFWEKMCVDFYGRLTAYASRLANGKEYDALDLVQETVLRVLFYAPNPKKVQSPLGYLLTVMRHVWTDKWDREGTAKTTSLEQVGETKSPVEATVEPEVLRILEN